MGLVSQEASMMPQLGRKHDCLKSMKIFLKEMSGFGETRHIHFRNGAKLLTRSMYLVCMKCSTTYSAKAREGHT